MTDLTPETSGLLLPSGARLLHVGPHKTGTTSLQAALWAARTALLEQGVRHIGKSRNPASAVRAVTGQNAATSVDTPPSIRHWQRLVADFRRAKEPRVVLSSEFFAWATPSVIERIAGDLDAERLHVAVTVRPLGRILPSQWQQNVQAGSQFSYDNWLRQLFGPARTRAATNFWWLHRHDELVARWATILGREKVTVVVVDERDHELLLRAFGGLLGLREGTLAPDRALANRSLTLEEVEAVRALNEAAKAAGIDRATHAAMIRFGTALHMKQRAPGPDEARIDTPQWALDAAREADEAIVAALGASGVRVVGDLASLAVPQLSRGEADGATGPVLAPPGVAAEMAMGIALASGLARRSAGSVPKGVDEDRDLAHVSPWQLGYVAWRRGLSTGLAKAAGIRRRLARRTGRSAAAAVPVDPAPARPEPAAGVDAQVRQASLPGPLPDGTRILHIGPPKTGTTSVQGAFWAARGSALAQGVRYAGKGRHSAHAVWAVTGRRSFDEGRTVPPIDHWEGLLAEIRGAPERMVVLSSEGFSYASDAAIERVVADLDAARTTVVVTLRPLAKVLASEWQEHAQSGLETPFETWLHNLFHEPSLPMTVSFWRRQRHDRLIERWARAVGAENVVVIVVDDQDHDALLRTFEALCGMRSHTLEQDGSTANRSLTLEEVTAIRALRDRWDGAGLSMAAFHRVVRMKVAAGMKVRPVAPDEPRIETPQWALDLAAAVADEVVAGIAATGVRVIGDLETLRVAPRGAAGECLPEVRIPPAISASMAMAMLKASGAAGRPGGVWVEPVEAARVPTRRLLRAIARQAARGVTRRGATAPREGRREG